MVETTPPVDANGTLIAQDPVARAAIEKLAPREYVEKAERMILDELNSQRKGHTALLARVEALEPKPYDRRNRQGTCGVKGCPEVGQRFFDTHPTPYLLLRTHICEQHYQERQEKKTPFVMDLFTWEAHWLYVEPSEAGRPGIDERFDELQRQVAGVTADWYEKLTELESQLTTRLANLERDALARGVKLGEPA